MKQTVVELSNQTFMRIGLKYQIMLCKSKKIYAHPRLNKMSESFSYYLSSLTDVFAMLHNFKNPDGDIKHTRQFDTSWAAPCQV